MVRAELDNGVAIYYEGEPGGRVMLRYPDGSRVETTWSRLVMVEKLTHTLQEAYEMLLKHAAGDQLNPEREVDTLVRIDDVLFAASRRGIPAPTG